MKDFVLFNYFFLTDNDLFSASEIYTVTSDTIAVIDYSDNTPAASSDESNWVTLLDECGIVDGRGRPVQSVKQFPVEFV